MSTKILKGAIVYLNSIKVPTLGDGTVEIEFESDTKDFSEFGKGGAVVQTSTTIKKAKIKIPTIVNHDKYFISQTTPGVFVIDGGEAVSNTDGTKGNLGYVGGTVCNGTVPLVIRPISGACDGFTATGDDSTNYLTVAFTKARIVGGVKFSIGDNDRAGMMIELEAYLDDTNDNYIMIEGKDISNAGVLTPVVPGP